MALATAFCLVPGTAQAQRPQAQVQVWNQSSEMANVYINDRWVGRVSPGGMATFYWTWSYAPLKMTAKGATRSWGPDYIRFGPKNYASWVMN
jgi:hypothetical protein